jgi:hypothetical protein
MAVVKVESMVWSSVVEKEYQLVDLMELRKGY